MWRLILGPAILAAVLMCLLFALFVEVLCAIPGYVSSVIKTLLKKTGGSP